MLASLKRGAFIWYYPFIHARNHHHVRYNESFITLSLTANLIIKILQGEHGSQTLSACASICAEEKTQWLPNILRKIMETESVLYNRWRQRISPLFRSIKTMSFRDCVATMYKIQHNLLPHRISLATRRLQSRPNVSTLQCRVFIGGDLMLKIRDLIYNS